MDFASWKHDLWKFRKLRNCPSSWCSWIPMAITSSFQLQFAHRLKFWTSDFPSFEKIYGMYKMDPRKCSKCVLQLLFLVHIRFLCFSSLHPRLVLAKGYEAPKLSFFMNLSFNLVFYELYKDLPHSWIALVIKKLSKTPKLNTIWLETITRVLNMPIEFKGNNYYSKVFKRVNYKL